MRKIKYASIDEERKLPERRAENEERSDFERDRSRIIHSSAFRRLQGKTQVFAPGEGDFYRTRLTHSIEVSQIAKGIALIHGANTDLVEAISLAHDLGHPPFGHAGEDELKALMEPHGGFEANAQNIRLLTQLEQKSTKYNGLNLTRATLDGQLKYKVPFEPGLRKFYYVEDQQFINWATKTAFPTQKLDEKSFECQIMDWADEVAYAVHDLEDGIHSGFITPKSFSSDSVSASVMNRTQMKLIEIYGVEASSAREVSREWDRLVQEVCRKCPELTCGMESKNLEYAKLKKHRKELTAHLIGKFIKSTEKKVKERVGALSVRYKYSLHVPQHIKTQQLLLNYLVCALVMDSSAVLTLEQKGRHIIRELFNLLMDDRNAKRLLPADWSERLQEHSNDSAKARVICDYLSGMTDEFAQRMYSRLFLPHCGSVRGCVRRHVKLV